MDAGRLNEALAGTRFAGRVRWLPRVESTNSLLLAEKNGEEGLVLLAGEQIAGRGTQGRSFYSPAGEGLYLSVLLRPRGTLEDLLTLTGRVAVAVRRAVEAASGAPCRIKWLNDITLNGRKVCGILTELADPEGDRRVVVGIGVNRTQSRRAFTEHGLGEIATSLAAEGYSVEGETLALAILRELEELCRRFPGGNEDDLRDYRARCVTIGRRVRTSAGIGLAEDVDESFALLVDGEPMTAGRAELL